MNFLYDLFKAAGLFVAYYLGLKTTRSEVEAKTNKAALDQSQKAIGKEEVVRLKYDKLKKDTPDNWGAVARMRSSSGTVPKATKA